MDLLMVERSTLEAELEQNPSLAARFYRGLACMLSRRSRDQLTELSADRHQSTG